MGASIGFPQLLLRTIHLNDWNNLPNLKRPSPFTSISIILQHPRASYDVLIRRFSNALLSESKSNDPFAELPVEAAAPACAERSEVLPEPPRRRFGERTLKILNS